MHNCNLLGLYNVSRADYLVANNQLAYSSLGKAVSPAFSSPSDCDLCVW